jgi:sodium pump decarboxylase gamma subunit
MNLGSLIFDGLKAMVLGMLWVFCFLSIMIVCMKVMSKALAPFSNFLEPVAPAPKKKKASGAKAALSPEDRVRALAAIEAVKLYRAGK